MRHEVLWEFLIINSHGMGIACFRLFSHFLCIMGLFSLPEC